MTDMVTPELLNIINLLEGVDFGPAERNFGGKYCPRFFLF